MSASTDDEQPRKRTPDETAELVEKLKVDYGRGRSLKQLERSYGIAASHIGRMLKRAGVELRPPSSVNHVRHEAWGGLNREQQRLYAERLRNVKRK